MVTFFQRIVTKVSSIGKRKLIILSSIIVVLAGIGIFVAIKHDSIFSSFASVVEDQSAWSPYNETGLKMYAYVRPTASSERFLKKYPQGISRSYLIIRKDGTKFEANFNIKNTNNPSNYSFDSGTKIDITTEVVLWERPDIGKMYMPGRFWLDIRNRKLSGCDEYLVEKKEVELEGVLKGKPIDGGGQYYTKTHSFSIPNTKCNGDKMLEIYYLYHAGGYYRSLPLTNYESFPIYLSSRSAGVYIPPAPPFPLFYTYSAPNQTCASLPPDSSEPGTISYTINPGWNSIIVPGDLVDIDTSAFFNEKSLEIYDYNLNAYDDWHLSTSSDHSDLAALHRRRGYLVKSGLKCPKKITAKTISNIQDEKVVLRRGWNLLANSKGKDVKFAEMSFRVVLQNLGGKCNSPNENSQACKIYKECSDNFGTCSEEKTMAELYQTGSGSAYWGGTRAWKDIYVYPLNVFSTSHSSYSPSEDSFHRVTITQNNLNDVVIPANNVFWFYLSE